MADPRFYAAKGPFSLHQLAEISGAVVHPASDPDRQIRDVAPLETAGAGDLSFLVNNRYVSAFSRSAAGACVIDANRVNDAPPGMALLVSENPYRSYALGAQAFYPAAASSGEISPDAMVDPSATIGHGTSVGNGAVVGARAEIGERCAIGPNAVIGEGVVVGDDCWIGACVSLAFCLIGSRVRIFAGARIGEDGFGFAPDPNVPVNVPQLGRVLIGNDVEIGANSAVDRGAGPDTVIGDGCRIDNLVQIGHNVELGRGCIIVAQVGISGSTKLGDHVVVGGQAGIAGHLTIGKGARIAAMSGIMRDVPENMSYAGFPAMPAKRWFRILATVQRLAQNKGQ